MAFDPTFLCYLCRFFDSVSVLVFQIRLFLFVQSRQEEDQKQWNERSTFDFEKPQLHTVSLGLGYCTECEQRMIHSYYTVVSLRIKDVRCHSRSLTFTSSYRTPFLLTPSQQQQQRHSQRITLAESFRISCCLTTW